MSLLMDTEVFDVFDLSEYIFYEIARGRTRGNEIVSEYTSIGVFKLRTDFVRGDNNETKESNATLHIRSTESFLSDVSVNLVGHGIQAMGQYYEIIGQTGGKNYHNGVMEHYALTLQESSFVRGLLDS